MARVAADDAGPSAFDVQLSISTGRTSPDCESVTIKVRSILVPIYNYMSLQTQLLLARTWRVYVHCMHSSITYSLLINCLRAQILQHLCTQLELLMDIVQF